MKDCRNSLQSPGKRPQGVLLGRITRWLKLSTAVVVTAALCMTSGCSSTGGRPTATSEQTLQGGVVAMITHGAPGDTFWDLVRKGAQDAADAHGMELRYSADPQLPNQANYIQSAVDARVDGIAMTMTTPEALGTYARKAEAEGIPVVGLNAGYDSWKDYGMRGYFGQDEKMAGEEVGKRLTNDQASNVLCIIHEQGNSSQESRCAGIASQVPTENLYVNGQDLSTAMSTIQAKLGQDSSIDWIIGLVAPVALVSVQAKNSAHSSARIGTFDTNAALIGAIESGDIQFAVDQQPYVQGYMAVEALWLSRRNDSTIGGGSAVLTGPAFIDSTNASTVAEAAREGLR